MRILALVPDAFGGYGGIALYNRDFLTALCCHNDCEEVVVIPRLMSSESEPLPKGLTHVTSGLGGKSRYLKTVIKTVQSSKNFDLIVCGHINLLPIAFFIKLWLGVPVLLEIYGIDAWQPHRNPFVNFLARRVDAFVSISEITKKRFLSWAHLDSSQGFILPNAIHLEQYGIAPKNEELVLRYGLRGKRVLMTFGRLVSHERAKGFDEVLELLPELVDHEPAIAYVIAGAGPDRERLEAKAQELGVSERVVFTGMVPEEEKADLFRLADVYVMPSRGEGFGFVFLEAMACGILVVASKVDGSREAVRDGALGILVDPDNPVEIKAGIIDALQNHKEIPDGLQYFSFNNFSQRLHRIVEELVKRNQ